MLKNFSEIFAELQGREVRKCMIVAWGVDNHTVAAAGKAVELGLVNVTIVGDRDLVLKACKEENINPDLFTIEHNPNELSSVAQAVNMVREGKGGILMKGLCSTDKFLRAVLNKETGILPLKGILTHCAVFELPS